MPDKMEREIEEILAKLDTDSPRATAEKTPVSIMSRKKRASSSSPRAKNVSARPTFRLTPTALLFTGAGVMIVGLILSTAYSQLIWASFAGVVLFLLAFAWSFRRTPRVSGGSGGSAPQGHYWRDRYIEYQPSSPGIGDRLRKRFRK
jgi:Flp pilus assembly protein TadB